MSFRQEGDVHPFVSEVLSLGKILLFSFSNSSGSGLDPEINSKVNNLRVHTKIILNY
jgi:hypothetical protein